MTLEQVILSNIGILCLLVEVKSSYNPKQRILQRHTVSRSRKSLRRKVARGKRQGCLVAPLHTGSLLSSNHRVGALLINIAKAYPLIYGSFLLYVILHALPVAYALPL